jgi:hypothetical protein
MSGIEKGDAFPGEKRCSPEKVSMTRKESEPAPGRNRQGEKDITGNQVLQTKKRDKDK